MSGPIASSFRRLVRGGVKQQQLTDLISLMNSVSLSSSKDWWVFNISGDGSVSVKAIRNYLDDHFLPPASDPNRWVKSIPLKINVFAWRARRDCLPTSANLVRRGYPKTY
nr:RNA-directed DNA polymerase, eukaryota [Tanacetum cinerariifolium]